jgi:ABC-type uncharacterized transport system auxiliary subunit
MKRLLLLTLLAPILAGCLGSAPPVPRDHYYRLLVPMPADSGGTMLLPGVLTVELLQADGLLRERPLLYSAGADASELQQHNYHYWNDVPPRLLQDQMVTYLRRSGIASLVVTPDTRVRAEYQVSGKAKRFERLVGGGGSKVVVEIEFALQRLSDDALLVVDTYNAEESASDDSVEASILALNRATARVFGAFLTDVRLAATRSASLMER